MEKSVRNNQQNTAATQGQRFRSLATILLSATTSFMIALPFAQSTHPVVGILALAVGLAVGYRRRNDQWFFYLVALITLIMSSLLAGQTILKQ